MANAKPAVGQEVVVAQSGSWDVHYTFGYKVEKVTPSGQVVIRMPSVERTRRFGADGREIGGGYKTDWLEFDVAGIRAKQEESVRCRSAIAAIKAVRVEPGSREGKESLKLRVQELEGLLAAAKAAVEAI